MQALRSSMLVLRPLHGIGTFQYVANRLLSVQAAARGPAPKASPTSSDALMKQLLAARKHPDSSVFIQTLKQVASQKQTVPVTSELLGLFEKQAPKITDASQCSVLIWCLGKLGLSVRNNRERALIMKSLSNLCDGKPKAKDLMAGLDGLFEAGLLVSTLRGREFIALRVPFTDLPCKPKLLPAHREACTKLTEVLKQTYPSRHFHCDVFAKALGGWVAVDIKRNKRILGYVIPHAIGAGAPGHIHKDISRSISRTFADKPMFLELAPEEEEVTAIVPKKKGNLVKEQVKVKQSASVDAEEDDGGVEDDDEEEDGVVDDRPMFGRRRNRPAPRRPRN